MRALQAYRRKRARIVANQQTYKVESLFRYGINQIAQHCRDWTDCLRFLIDNIRRAKAQYQSPDSIIV